MFKTMNKNVKLNEWCPDIFHVLSLTFDLLTATLLVMKLQQLRSSVWSPQGLFLAALSLEVLQAPQGLTVKPAADPPQSSEQITTPV